MKYQKPKNATAEDAGYVDANPAEGIAGSIPPAKAIEQPMREIVNVITSAGLTPSDENLTQLNAAIDAKIAASGPANLGDLAFLDTVGTDDIEDASVTAEKLAAGAATITGTVLAYASQDVPAGWLECNGAELSRTTYANLFAVVGETYGAGDASTTFNLPDLRGGFIRGFDNGAGIDSQRVFGSSQDDALQNITGTLYPVPVGDNVASMASVGAFIGSIEGTANYAAYSSGGYIKARGKVSFDASKIARTSTETRPVNTSMMYIIKY